MAEIKHTPEEITAFLQENGGGGCVDGISFCKENGIYGMEAPEAIIALEAQGKPAYANWIRQLMNTPAYVKFNGKEIIMDSNFEVFNPLAGTHTSYPDEESARQAVLEISQKILDIHKVSIAHSVSNENGDTAWTYVELSSPITVI